MSGAHSSETDGRWGPKVLDWQPRTGEPLETSGQESWSLECPTKDLCPAVDFNRFKCPLQSTADQRHLPGGFARNHHAGLGLVIAVDAISITEDAAARCPLSSLSQLVRHPREK
ncbi:jg20070 [Pararge aegeria aegeria]|uniref:Jg20070 protein n=1 Tax=Pararge aegeria aegeria TaxID=348720 RepID=A0A8S4SGN9_9NEOP|nr:jg20070 [Pararge aegeria aegeria]